MENKFKDRDISFAVGFIEGLCLLVGSDILNEQRHIRKTLFRFL